MTSVPEKLKNKLTIAETRLSGSDQCQNCGTELQGPYCHYCGQPDKNFFRFFPALLREMMGDLLDLDSRLTRTLKPLLFQPGKLANDYMHGRRFRYTSPVRLYLFSSIIFFLLAGFITNINIQENFTTTGMGGPIIQISGTESTPAETGAIEEKSKSAEKPEGIDLSAVQAKPDDNENIVNPVAEEEGNKIDPINLPFVPQRLNDWVNGELTKSESKGAAIEADPTLISNKIFDMLPMTVFALLPVFALLLKLFYMLSKRYYTEHLIFALYNHSFLFVLATVMLFLESSASWLANPGWISKSGWIFFVLDKQSVILLLWMPVYFWIALKRFYRQNWVMTSFKFTIIGLTYTILLASVTAFIALLSFLLL